jgi:hypothetical protein
MIATRLGVLLFASAVARSAWGQVGAEPQPAKHDPIAAETLFSRGKQLMEQGHTGQACEAFKESQELDPAGGTLLRLALCHEADGKLASAWLEFTEVVRVSQGAAGDPGKLAERVRLAREHLTSIEPRVPKLVIWVPAAVRVDGLAVTANGLPRNEGTWGVAIPVDAGDVTFEATAPGRKAFRTTVRTEDGKEARVEVPPLEPAAAPEAPAPAAAPPEATAGSQRPAPLRPVAIAAGAVGLVALGVGTYFGISAVSKWNDSNAHCPSPGCDAQGVSSAHDAKQAALVSDVAIGIGVAGVAAGAILYFVGAPKTVQARADGVAIRF